MNETGRNGYSYRLRQTLKDRFPGCTILRNDPSSNFQGVPDITILYQDRWAMLEIKRDGKAKRQPNQAFFVDKFNDMSFCAFIHPDNEEDVLNDLQHAFQAGR